MRGKDINESKQAWSMNAKRFLEMSSFCTMIVLQCMCMLMMLILYS